MNKVVLVGRLTKDMELKYTQKGTAVASFTLAIDRRFKSQTGEKETDFINCVAWGAVGETASKYVGKGSQIGVAGRIQTRSYEAKDGGKRYVTEVVAEEIEFMGSAGQKEVVKAEKVDMNDWEPMDSDLDSLPF